MAAVMKVVSIKMTFKDKENTSGQMEENLAVNGNQIKFMVKDNSNGPTEEFMRVILCRIKKKDMVK